MNYKENTLNKCSAEQYTTGTKKAAFKIESGSL